jgi:galactokinase
MSIDQVPAGTPDDIARRLMETFTETHGREAVGCFAAPGRVNLIGEHIDYNDGKCLPMALPHATYAAVAPREDSTVTVTSLQQDDRWKGRLDGLGPGDVQGWPAYVAGVAWAMRQDGFELPGVDIVVDSRVPVGAGLSSSAALECSVALGLCAVAGVEVDLAVRQRLVSACMRAETEVAGAPTGGMDQTVSLLATAEHALLIDCRDWSTEQVPWDPAAAGLDLLVVDTRASHSLTDGGYEARRKDCEAAAAALGVASLREVEDRERALSTLASLKDDRVRRRARHVFTEMARVEAAVDALGRGDFTELGRSFYGSHESLRDDFEVSAPELDVVVETARAHGALGARMTGGGFGGSAIALVPADAADKVSEAVAAAFDDRGWASPGFLHAPPGGGAGRIR